MCHFDDLSLETVTLIAGVFLIKIKNHDLTKDWLLVRKLPKQENEFYQWHTRIQIKRGIASVIRVALVSLPYHKIYIIFD